MLLSSVVQRVQIVSLLVLNFGFLARRQIEHLATGHARRRSNLGVGDTSAIPDLLKTVLEKLSKTKGRMDFPNTMRISWGVRASEVRRSDPASPLWRCGSDPGNRHAGAGHDGGWFQPA